MKPSKPTFTQSLHSALQLDFFSDLVGALLPSAKTPTPVAPKSLAPKTPRINDSDQERQTTNQTNDNNDNKLNNLNNLNTSTKPNEDASHTVAPTTTEPSKKLSLHRRQILIQDQVLEYELRRSKRRSIGFLIADEGLRITAPRWVTINEIEQAIQEKQKWIFTKLREKRERLNKRMQPTIVWEDGAQFPYLGEPLILRISTTQRSGIFLSEDGQEIIVCLPPDATEQQLKDRVQSWLQQEAKRIFNARLPIYAEKLNVSYQSMSLTSAATRWGSCTSDGKIRLNWRLIHFTPEIIDYVIAHELAHLIEMNHSADFWTTVESVFPEYEQVKQKLRQHSTQDLPVF